MDAPPLEMATGNVTTNEVVERVKCELAYAFAAQLNGVDKEKFLWMQNWTVKADMTLQANLQEGLTPSAGYTQNFHNAYNRAAGPTLLNGAAIAPIPQFFNLGASANLGEQAFRTETISFSLSLKELSDWLKKNEEHDPQFFNRCFPAKGSGMAGDLGLAEWVNAALAPVHSDQLQAGYHPAPGTSSSAKPSTVGAPGAARMLKDIKSYCAVGNPKETSESEIKNMDDDISKLIVRFNKQYKEADFAFINNRRALNDLKELKESYRPVLMKTYRDRFDWEWNNFFYLIGKKLDDLDIRPSMAKKLNAFDNMVNNVKEECKQTDETKLN